MSGDRSSFRIDSLRSGLTDRIIHRIRTQWEHYWIWSGVLVLAGVLAMGRPFVARHGTTPPLPHTDTIILEYVGWYASKGGTIYTDIWEIKPPLAFLPSYLFGLLTGSNIYAHHLLGIAFTALTFATAAALTARIVGSVTDAPVAGLASAVVLFANPTLFLFPWMGYKAKFLAFALGLAAVERALAERWRWSGALGGLAVGVWQLAILFPVLSAVYAVRDPSVDAVRAQVVGWIAAGGVLLGTVLLYADPAGFVAEALLGPVVLQSERGAFDPDVYFRYFAGNPGRWLTVLGVAGLLLAAIDRTDTDRWPLALGGALAGGLLLIDSDGLSDTIYPLVFTAIGIGVLVSYLPRRSQVASVLVLALMLSTAFAPMGFFRHDPVELRPSDGMPPSPDAERESLYWNATMVESCRFFAGQTQRSILAYYPEDTALTSVPCGNLSLYWRVTAHKLLGGPDPAPVGGTSAPANPEEEGTYRPVDDATIIVGNGSATGWNRYELTNRAGSTERVTVRVTADGRARPVRRYSLDHGDRLSVRITDAGPATIEFAVAGGHNSSFERTVDCHLRSTELIITGLDRIAKRSTQTTVGGCREGS
jgi:hypothetical protein